MTICWETRTWNMQKMSTKTICLNRDPVCAADDVDEHKRVIVIPADMTVKDFIWMLRNDYLWEVWRGKWTALAHAEREMELTDY